MGKVRSGAGLLRRTPPLVRAGAWLQKRGEMTDIKIGSVWECKQDGRRVMVVDTASGEVLVRATLNGNKSNVRQDQFERRYRYLAASDKVGDLYPGLFL
jgi:hypothetical protein